MAITREQILQRIVRAKSAYATELAQTVGVKSITFGKMPAYSKTSNQITIVFGDGQKLVFTGEGNEFDGPWIEDNWGPKTTDELQQLYQKLRQFDGLRD